MQKKIEDLSLLDDFLFGAVMSYPEIGREVCKRIVSIIIGREIKKIKIIPQKIYYGTDTDKHGIRLDVYAEEDDDGINTIYDIEPDKNDKPSFKNSLPKRVRFYHAKIDADCLESGADYSKLKRVIIIFISPYDPFHMNRMVYTIQNRCVEEPDLLYDDGAKTIFLYTKGTKGNPPKDLQKLLHYLEDSTKANAENSCLHDIHQMVETVRHDKEVSLEYMKIFEREKMIREEGREKGLEEGREEERRNLIRKMIQKNFSVAEIADFLELEEDYVKQISQLAGENPADDVRLT